ncbi:hypothetical protein AVEN_275034-1 [Araneus ventricosus]|uniref:Uncharacterized protein n=1 Tax=Araneus ventricosus TaxID=182803 RepID=A0A4Y2EW70_ARAVE|nr:hypothetical protein AVEN_275034-1 [Araneus ventricosus]
MKLCVLNIEIANLCHVLVEILSLEDCLSVSVHVNTTQKLIELDGRNLEHVFFLQNSGSVTNFGPTPVDPKQMCLGSTIRRSVYSYVCERDNSTKPDKRNLVSGFIYTTKCGFVLNFGSSLSN